MVPCRLLIAETLTRETEPKSTSKSRMHLMREVAKRLVRISSIVSLDTLTQDELRAAVTNAFAEAVEA